MEHTDELPREPILVLETGSAMGKFFSIRKDVRIGRHPSNEITLSDLAVSRRHAQIEVKGADIYILDLGSVNGTFVNGAQVKDRRRIVNGDKIRVGQTDLAFRTGTQ